MCPDRSRFGPIRLRVLLLAALLCGGLAGDLAAIPLFARRYRVSCILCHNPVPALTPYGEDFAANGFRLRPGETAPDTVTTGDPLLTLLRDVPLALRLDAYIQEFTNGNAVTDFETPYALKLLSSGGITGSLSYYFYTFLFERGEIGGVEDAFLYLNDVGGAPVDLQAGQFQVSDPMFKRELRLEFEDYAVYRARLGDSPVDLTYDRGLLASADLLGFALTGQVLNGNGRGAAGENRRFDNDAGKNLALRVSRDVVSGVRLGGFGYYGRTTSDAVRDETTMLGVDATLSRGPLELNVQYLHRENDAPLFLVDDEQAQFDGGFVELLVRPLSSRWHGWLLYNLVNADRPILSVRLGEENPIRRYQAVAGGAGYLLRRNFRVVGEVTVDLEGEGARFTTGFVSAF